jgi:valyl-tRNA synthetase
MLPAYHPSYVEAAWGAWWEKCGFYSCDPAAAEAAGPEGRFVMVIPPPNVTGSLHLGHALTAAVEDCLTRWHRMCGRPVMWLPGTDHAGIATQAVVEKRLMKERGVTRHDLGRDDFVKEVWDWKETYGNRITSQLRGMGVSTDWSRERFTMDPQLSRAVVEAFVRLHERGLLYRDTKLVNWCCRLRTAISDIEVEYIDIDKRTRLAVPGHDPAKTYEFGVLTSFAYKVKGSPTGEEVVVATTRPETMLGDVAVAVHPDDPRYKHLHGAALEHPFFPDRELRVIADGELVDMAFGTGAVKITPAHDPNDYKCGKRHGLPFITVFTEDGRVSDAGGPRFAGMMRFDARVAVVKALEEAGLGRGKADNKMRLGLCSRSGDVIEPLIKPQWYVKCDGMAKAAADAVRGGSLRLEPEMHKSTWFSWLDNIQDWCISRQLWWGHRIPAYFVAVAGRPRGEPSDPANWVVARTEDEARATAAAREGVDPAAITLEQDPDVLDTWFSSGLFPFATFGWPDEASADFKGFYPNSLLETGHDILFFWVARMVMLGLELTGRLPFTTVYLHAMVRDKYGRKMSKSLGNVIDPMEVIAGCDLETLHEKIRSGNLPPKEVETAIKGQKLDFPEGIPECGADALRFGLLAYTLQGRDINLDINRVVGYRQFCNKLWNATRFALAHLAPERGYVHTPLDDAVAQLTSPAVYARLAVRDKWILGRLDAAAAAVNGHLRGYAFAAACTAAYDFWLYELCDFYLELIKPLMASGDVASAAAAGGDVAEAQRLSRMTLAVCLDAGLRLLHPFMPFVTEELWQRLPGRGAPWSAAFPASLGGAVSAGAPAVEAGFALFRDAVRAGRSLRQDADIPPSKEAAFTVALGGGAAGDAARGALEAQHRDLVTLLRASSLTLADAGAAGGAAAEGGASSVSVVSEAVSLHLHLRGLIDPAVELKKLAAKALKLEDEAGKMRKRASAPGYEDKVPADVRAAAAEALASHEAQLATVRALQAQYTSWLEGGAAAAQ